MLASRPAVHAASFLCFLISSFDDWIWLKCVFINLYSDVKQYILTTLSKTYLLMVHYLDRCAPPSKGVSSAISLDVCASMNVYFFYSLRTRIGYLSQFRWALISLYLLIVLMLDSHFMSLLSTCEIVVLASHVCLMETIHRIHLLAASFLCY